MSMDHESGFNAVLLFYRSIFIKLHTKLESEYDGVSNELLERIQAIIDKYTGANGKISKEDLQEVKDDLDAVTFWFSRTYSEWIDRNIAKSIDIAILGHDTAAQYFIKNFIVEHGEKLGTVPTFQSRVLIQPQYGGGLNNAIRQSVWNQRWVEDGLKLSDRIWTTDQTLRNNLHSMIEQCVNDGRSAVEFSRAVEQYLVEPGPKWTTAIKPAVTDRGSVKYNALRLARTEINQAYHRSQNLAAMNNPTIRGLKWNLSRSHPKKDICDTWATQDIHGLGSGIYRPGETPKDHPNGMCFLTMSLYQGTELISILKQKYHVA